MLLAHVLGAQRQLAGDLLVDGGRHANSAGLGDGFQPRRNIDGVAQQVLAAFHHVAEVDADAQHHLVVGGRRVVGRPHGLLDLECGADGFDGTGELRQQAIAGQLEDASPVVLDQRLRGRHAIAQQGEGVFLIAGRHRAEADDVDIHDRGQAPDELGIGHGNRLADSPRPDHMSRR